MKNLLSDKRGRNCNKYDIIFIDVPYIDNNYINQDLEIKMIQYRNQSSFYELGRAV